MECLVIKQWNAGMHNPDLFVFLSTIVAIKGKDFPQLFHNIIIIAGVYASDAYDHVARSAIFRYFNSRFI